MLSEIADSEKDAASACKRTLTHAGIAAAIIIVGIVEKDQFSWVEKYLRKGAIALKNWITAFFERLVHGVTFFEGTRFEFVPKVCSPTASGSGWRRAFSSPQGGDSAGGYCT
jgi:hypothetical protein